jgi:hypothetical protein
MSALKHFIRVKPRQGHSELHQFINVGDFVFNGFIIGCIAELLGKPNLRPGRGQFSFNQIAVHRGWGSINGAGAHCAGEEQCY